MRTITKLALAGAASLALAGQANAAVITFSGLTTPGAAFTSLTEAGFTITNLPGFVTTSAAGGSLAFGGTGGTIQIVLTAGGTFSAGSFSMLGAPASYWAQGFLGSTLVGQTFGAGTGSFASYAGPSGLIDRLTINLSSAQTVVGGLDNIEVTAGTVQPAIPEPATWAMMLAGFGIVGAGMRRGKQVVRVKFA